MTPEEQRKIDLRRRQLKARLSAAPSAASAANQDPQYASNGVPMNDAAKAEIIARANGGNMTATQSPESMAMDGAAAAVIAGPTAASILGNFGAGTNIGMADMAGFPVDAMTGGINGLGALTGAWGPIENPVGGSEFFRRVADPLTSMIPEPTNAPDRVARRMGEEVGAATIAAPLAFASPIVRAAPGVALATEAASALGSGAGAAAANEIAPGSVTAEIIGALAGGLTGGVGSGWLLGAPQGYAATIRGGIDEQKAIAADAYDMVRADKRIIPQESVDDMALGLMAKMDAERINPRLQPGSSAVLDAIIGDSAKPMRIEDIENLRRLTQQGLPATAAPADQRLAGMMKDDLTAYLDNMQDPVADALVDGRNATRRYKAAETIDAASTKAARRAASAGSGGNEINAMRQNLRGVLDNPNKSRSFTPAEREMMDAVVRGDTGQNAMRSLSRFAPTSGGLSAILGVGGAIASPAVALPIMAVTELAKAGGERSTRKAIEALMQSLAPSRMLKPSEQGISPVIAALLAGRTMAGGE